MKRNALSALIALSLLGGGAVAQAQDFGNWYIAPRIGADIPDSNRKTDASVWGGIGVGVWVNPHLAVDFECDSSAVATSFVHGRAPSVSWVGLPS